MTELCVGDDVMDDVDAFIEVNCIKASVRKDGRIVGTTDAMELIGKFVFNLRSSK